MSGRRYIQGLAALALPLLAACSESDESPDFAPPQSARPDAEQAGGAASGGSAGAGGVAGGSVAGAGVAGDGMGGAGLPVDAGAPPSTLDAGDPVPVPVDAGMPTGGDAATGCENPLADPMPFPFPVTESVDHYDFGGSTVAEMRAQITPQQPRPGSDARTVWAISWTFDSPDGCQTAVFDLELDVTYDFPRWSEPAGADPAVVAEWERYVDALWCHEYGHTTFGLDAALAIQHALDGLGPQPGCAALQAQASATFDATLQPFLDDEILYDEQTDHGATMGARFPLTDP